MGSRRDDIVDRLARQYSTAAVLLHHAVAQSLGLEPTDLKCLDLMRERGSITGSDLVTLTGLTSGAITGVITRLERAGYVRRKPDPDDGRRQILYPVAARLRELHELFTPMREEMDVLLRDFDRQQVAAIGDFLARGASLLYRHLALLRGEALRRRR